MPLYKGGYYCGSIRYKVSLESVDEARTSVCHCRNCKRFTGGPFGVTTKIPVSSYSMVSGRTTEHVADNGSGTSLYREFCGTCGGPILEYGKPVKDKFRYIFTGTFDDPSALPPKGEFFCKYREKWVPEVEGVFRKQEIHE